MDPIEPRPSFLPQGKVREIVESLEQKYPRVFSQDRVRVVGVDVPPAEILDNESNVVESVGGVWRLRPGVYQIRFGFVPGELREIGIVPRFFWRSSDHRLGVGGGKFVADAGDNELRVQDDYFSGEELVGDYRVWNPHGVVIEVGAGVAQMCFTRGNWANEIVSAELLKPMQISQFTGPGIIGREKTILPDTEVLLPINGEWELKGDTPYLVELRGRVSLQKNEVLVPWLNLEDWRENEKLMFLRRYSCLGDPGYKGRLGMLVVPQRNLNLGADEGIARVAKYGVIQVGQLAEYQGQWLGVGEESDSEIKFRSIYETPIFEDLMEKW